MPDALLRSSAVDAFLAKARAGIRPQLGGDAAPSGRGRLIFAVDGTASRQPSWDLATGLTVEMFQEAGAIGGLEMQLVYFRGAYEFRSTGWVSDSAPLIRLMGAIHCESGPTQIGKVLLHAQRENSRQNVAALVFVGDAVEEGADGLLALARALGAAGTRAFMFLEGDEPRARRLFADMAMLSGGAFSSFGPGAADKLRELLRAVAAVAAGGIEALEARQDSASVLLLTQMRH
jgi:hypothetical protein